MLHTVIIHMNEIFKGPTRCVSVPGDDTVTANVSESGEVVSYEFLGSRWDESKARKFLRNRKLNKIAWRQHKDGEVVFNHIRLESDFTGTVEPSKVEDILGSEVFNKLMKIENEHSSDKPFLVSFVAMNFEGKDKKVANGLRFNRKDEIKNIDDFGGIKIHPGHLGFFESWRDPIGNTVAPYVDDNGNPSAYGYINPFGGGKEFRDQFKVAAAQDLLHNFPVSMAGRPIKYELLNEEDQKEPANYGVYANVLEWSRMSMDIVFDPAIEGSEAQAIVNRKGNDELLHISSPKKRRIKKVDYTFSEIITALKDMDDIALSDFMRVPAFKDAIDAHVKQEVANMITLAGSDEETLKTILDSTPEDVLLKNSKFKNVMAGAMEIYLEDLDKCKESVDSLAKNAKIELNTAQLWLVQNGIKEPLEEEAVIKRIEDAAKLTDFSDVPGFSLTKIDTQDKTITTEKSTGGPKVTEVDAEEARKHIV